jgi:hypothetical protein
MDSPLKNLNESVQIAHQPAMSPRAKKASMNSLMTNTAGFNKSGSTMLYLPAIGRN